VRRASLHIPQHLPSGIEGQDRVLITTGIGMVLFHQGPIGGLDLRAAGAGGHSEHLIGIGAGQGATQSWGPVSQARWWGSNKKPPPKRGLGQAAEATMQVLMNQNLNWAATKAPNWLLPVA